MLPSAVSKGNSTIRNPRVVLSRGRTAVPVWAPRRPWRVNVNGRVSKRRKKYAFHLLISIRRHRLLLRERIASATRAGIVRPQPVPPAGKRFLLTGFSATDDVGFFF